MKILVTGGAGYIGSHAVRALLRKRHDLLVFDNLSTGHRAAVDPGAQLVEGDLRDEGLLTEALEDVDAVMHFAARSIVGESMDLAIDYWQNNVAGSLSLLKAMQTRGVERLVFSSTAATYGVPEQLPITEDTPQAPINPYGATKLAVEQAIRDTVRSRPAMAATVLRYFNVAGCSHEGGLGEDHRPETHLIPIVLQAAAGRRESVSIFGTDYPTHDGTCVRDYVHVEDLVEAHLVALEAMEPGRCRAYNVGIGRGHSVREVMQAARRVTGVAFAVNEAPRRQGDPPVLYTDPTRLMEELGWKPRHVEIDDMIASAWAWTQAHPDGYGARP